MLKLCIPFTRYVAVFVFAVFGFVTDVRAQEKIFTWDAEKLATVGSCAGLPVLSLRNGPKGEVLVTISTDTLLRLVQVKNRVAGAANQPAQLYVSTGTTPNAFASKKDGTPKITINVAMINLFGNDSDAYAAVIGHELAHLVRDHGVTREAREGARSAISPVLGTVLSTVFGRYGGSIAGTVASNVSGTIASNVTTAVSRTFSREEEREADSLGIGYMKQAGYDPMGGVRAWEQMGTVAKSRSVSFLSTHPAPEERLQTMRTLAQSQTAPSPIASASPTSGGVTQDSSLQAGQTSAQSKDDEVVRLVRLCADQGNAQGQVNLGRMYALGQRGLPKNDVEAVRLFRLAADQGNAVGQALLGFRYLTGQGGLPKDDTEAARLFQLSANQNNSTGQFALGFVHENGRAGIPKDSETAIHWYRLAAQQGNLAATTSLKRLEGTDQQKNEAIARSAQEEAIKRPAEQPTPGQAQLRNEYLDRIRAKIKGFILLPPNMQGNPEAEFNVVLQPNGNVLSVKLTRTSGNADYDSAVERAIMKAQPFPLPPDPAMFKDFQELNIKFRPKAQTEIEVAAPSVADILNKSAQIARLEAQIDKDMESFQKRPRRRFVGARIQEARFARYVEDWRLKLERVGTLNYPQAARDQKIHGSLQLTVSIKADGTVEHVEINRSSGQKILDDAALRIVRLGAPYSAFPDEIAKDTDILSITRTWTFTGADQFAPE